VRDYVQARMSGDTARDLDDYWVLGVGARTDVLAESCGSRPAAVAAWPTERDRLHVACSGVR
jgi:hypothetical protein